MKRCPKCGEFLQLDQFFRNANKKDGHQGYCKKCWAAHTTAREARIGYEPYRHATHVRRQFGVTDYGGLLAEQENGCALRGKPETWKGRGGKVQRLAVDHDPRCCAGKKSCGRCVRGLLCRRCNQMLGQADNDPDLLRRMASYIEQVA